MSAEIYIKRTFELANMGLGTTWPNPLVGAVIVKNGKVIGEGFHKRAGEDHAELTALKNCTESPAGSTIYVNLEPCCHTHKQTPPCAQRLIQENIKKVVICNLDPNPSVNGKGVELLRQNGIEVEHGILKDRGERLNEVFFLAQKKKRPFIYLKMATSLDGKISLPNGESKWITGEASRNYVHVLRSQHQAVMVGAGTIRKDNPELNVRLSNYQGAQPYRVIISESGQIPSHQLRDRTLFYSSIEVALEDLYQRKIINVLLEGGPHLAGSFLSKNLIDRVGLFLNPSFIGEGKNMIEGFSLNQLNERPRLKDVEVRMYGEDLFLTGIITS